MQRDGGTAYVYTLPTNGECDNTTRDSCVAGTVNSTAITDTSTHYRWRCDGVNGGANSSACQLSKATTPGNEGYCTITNKVTKQEISRFNVDGVNVSIGGSDLAIQDTVYDLQCQYKEFAADGSFDTWQSVTTPPITVKVLPQDVSEQNITHTSAPCLHHLLLFLVPQFGLLFRQVPWWCMCINWILQQTQKLILIHSIKFLLIVIVPS